jgi:preprotein translocase subunit SecY
MYRIGAHVTSPGIYPRALIDFFAQQGSSGGLLGLYNLFTGGQLSRATVFALGIMPYISASIFMQIAGAVLPKVEKMQKDEEGRKRINQWTRYGTVALAAVQAYGFALFVESLPSVVARWCIPHADDVLPHDGRGVRHVARRADHGARHR